jgi:uracil phosphoribosyltransferase
MLATGGSLCDAIEVVKTKGAKEILSLNIIGAPEGLHKVQTSHPDVNIYISQIDERLNENKFIIPGLGDAGDREYNTPE